MTTTSEQLDYGDQLLAIHNDMRALWGAIHASTAPRIPAALLRVSLRTMLQAADYASQHGGARLGDEEIAEMFTWIIRKNKGFGNRHT